MKKPEFKLLIILLIASIFFIINRYGLFYNNISHEHFVFNQKGSCNNNFLYTDIDINNDKYLDSIYVCTHFYSGWLNQDSIISIITIPNFAVVGIKRLHSIKNYWIDIHTIEKNEHEVAVFIIESKNLNPKGKIFGWKVIGYNNGIFFERTPTILEYLYLLLDESVPKLEIN